MKKALWLGVLALMVSSPPARADDEEYSPPERFEEASESASSSDFEARAEAESEPSPDSAPEPSSSSDFESSSQWAHDDGAGTGNDTSMENLYPDASESGGD